MNQYDGAQNGFGDDILWLYIDGTTNAGVLRRVGSTSYAKTSGTMYVYGANLVAETASRTCYLSRFNRDNYIRAINRAIEQVPFFIPRDDLTLVTGNVLPDGHFEWWTSATALKFYSASSITLAKTTTAGLYRGQRGTTSMKCTASAANGYVYLHSDSWPNLLDIMGKTVSFYAWALPQTATDAKIEIRTKQADDTTQTLTSDTANPAGEFSLLKLENQSINDDLTEVEVRWYVVTDTKYVYYDDSILVGQQLRDYLLPTNLQSGHVSQAHIQTTGYSDKICYDIHPRYWDKQQFRVHGDINNTYQYLHLNMNSNYRRIRLIGSSPLSTLSADTDTVEVDGDKLNLITTKAAEILYRLEQGPVSSEDKGIYRSEIAMWEREYLKLLPSLMMSRPSETIYTG